MDRENLIFSRSGAVVLKKEVEHCIVKMGWTSSGKLVRMAFKSRVLWVSNGPVTS